MGFEIQWPAEADLHRRNASLALLAEGAKRLLSSETTEHMVQSFCEQVMAHLDCHVFSSFVSDAGRSRMRLMASAGMPAEFLQAVGCPEPGNQPWDCCHRPGCQRATGCTDRAAEAQGDTLQALDISAYACHPLVYRDRNIGTLAFGTGNRTHFSADDLGLMRAVADLVAAALARQQDQEALRASEARLSLALEGANAGAAEWNVQTGELTWSPQQCELYGIPQGRGLTLADWDAMLHPDDRPAVNTRLQACLAGEGSSFRDEWRIVHPERGTRWILGLGTIVRAGDRTPVRVFGINIDITERKQSEEELERRVAERTSELMAVNKELEGFTYAASHDMKGPLGRISSFSSLLGQYYRDRLEGDGLMFLDLIQQNALRLSRLVEDLLAHAHIGHQPLALQPVEAQAVVRAILLERMDDIHQRDVDVRLELPDGIAVLSNALGLSQVLRNLVDNALKYSSRATPPVIEIGARRDQGRCRLWIRDNGIGVEMAYKDKIFEIFRRLHTYSEYPGNGVGLALVKKAMERMDGKVWVESEPGRGATFFLDLPAAGSSA